jgi:hypothetical protein
VLSIVSAALSLAKRYKWIDENPAESATMPSPGEHEPDPPTPEQAAALLNLAFAEDEDFALFCWTAFTHRRPPRRAARPAREPGRLRAARLLVRPELRRQGRRAIEKPTKTGKGRHVSGDPLTCELIHDYLARRRASMAAVGVEVPRDAFVFSSDPAGAAPRGTPTP